MKEENLALKIEIKKLKNQDQNASQKMGKKKKNKVKQETTPSLF
jgi:regulator of replication initiation timing